MRFESERVGQGSRADRAVAWEACQDLYNFVWAMDVSAFSRSLVERIVSKWERYGQVVHLDSGGAGEMMCGGMVWTAWRGFGEGVKWLLVARGAAEQEGKGRWSLIVQFEEGQGMDLRCGSGGVAERSVYSERVPDYQENDRGGMCISSVMLAQHYIVVLRCSALRQTSGQSPRMRSIHRESSLKDQELQSTSLSQYNVRRKEQVRLPPLSFRAQLIESLVECVNSDSAEVTGKGELYSCDTGCRWLEVVQNAVQNLGIQNVGNQNGLIVVPKIANQNLNLNGNCNVVAARAEGNAIGNNFNQITCYNCKGLGHLARNCTVRPRKRDVAFLQTQIADCSKVSNVEQSGRTVEQHPATAKETRAFYDSLYNNLSTKVETVNSVNRNLKETNAELTTKLARYKNQEKCFEINQENYDKLERCYQKSVYQVQCLSEKINALHLSSTKTITILNGEIANLNNQVSNEKSTVSSLQEEKKKLKSDFKIREDELLDKQIQLENKIKELDNILV
ncbi:retrovirus-related pol polyprotein from transposon TNT 1-94, partial [Tanacetum coccineum]